MKKYYGVDSRAAYRPDLRFIQKNEYKLSGHAPLYTL